MSDEIDALVFRAEEYQDGDDKFLQNMGKFLPDYTLSHTIIQSRSKF
jgi:hypothetical protein